MMHIIFKITSTAIVFGGGTYLVYKLYLKKPEKEEPQVIKVPPAKVIFFTGANARCRRNCLTRRRKQICGEKCSLNKLNYLVGLIEHAQNTLDMCIYLITCNELAYAILRAFKRGVQVRIIVDEEMSTCTEAKTRLFINSGIPVKSKKTDALMHHKFCVIDHAFPERKLITGSLNWTLQGLAGNYEYVTIISHPIPVAEYEKEFNLLWKEFSLKY